jgi:hypothetical protein
VPISLFLCPSKGIRGLSLKRVLDRTLPASICSAILFIRSTLDDHTRCAESIQCVIDLCDGLLICTEAEEGGSRTCSSISVNDGRSDKVVWTAWVLSTIGGIVFFLFTALKEVLGLFYTVLNFGLAWNTSGLLPSPILRVFVYPTMVSWNLSKIFSWDRDTLESDTDLQIMVSKEKAKGES